MSIEKKSLLGNRAAVKKAMIASQSADATGDPKSLKSTTLAAHSMKKMARRLSVVSRKRQ